MVKWIKAIHTGNLDLQEVRTFLIAEFWPLFQLNPLPELTAFYNGPTTTVVGAAGEAPLPVNQITHLYSGTQLDCVAKQVEIAVSSIHGVKGETHSATLYMETFYYDHDIKRILPYFKIGAGNAIQATQQRVKETLKMAYVAMSRPSHFLCVAMSHARVNQQDLDQLTAVGWTIDTTLV
jgi:hypothetical protein